MKGVMIASIHLAGHVLFCTLLYTYCVLDNYQGIYTITKTEELIFHYEFSTHQSNNDYKYKDSSVWGTAVSTD